MRYKEVHLDASSCPQDHTEQKLGVTLEFSPKGTVETYLVRSVVPIASIRTPSNRKQTRQSSRNTSSELASEESQLTPNKPAKTQTETPFHQRTHPDKHPERSCTSEDNPHRTASTRKQYPS